MNGILGDGVFAGGDFEGAGVRGEIEVISLNATGGSIATAISVYGDKEIGLVLVSDGSAGLEGNEGVVVAGVHNIGT